MRKPRNAHIAAAVLCMTLQGYSLADSTAVSGPSMPELQMSSTLADQPMLDDQNLDAQRGGTAVVNDMKLDGVVSDNQAYNLSTGGNSISDGAFAGSSGVPMVIQNSGNNVLIQNATIVNVQVQ
jgi:hypothetical protein